VPKMVLPTLTSPLPMLIAPSKSSLIPMLNSSAPSPSCSSHSSLSFSSLRHLKSSFSAPSPVALDLAIAPIVMSPSSLRWGQLSMMCLASSLVSGPGETPDFASSPEVLTWMWMFSGVEEAMDERPALSCVAFFRLSTEETR